MKGRKDHKDIDRLIEEWVESPVEADLPRLEADPYLPARVRAMAEQGGEKAAVGPAAAGSRSGMLRWALASCLGIAAAVALGVQLGRGIAPSPSAGLETSVIREYYETLSPSSAFSDTEKLLASENEESS